MYVRDTVVLEFAPDAIVGMNPTLPFYVAIATPDELRGARVPYQLKKAARFIREQVVPRMRPHLIGSVPHMSGPWDIRACLAV